MDWSALDKKTILQGVDAKGNRLLSKFFRDYKKAFPGSNPNASCMKCFDEYYLNMLKLKDMKEPKNKSKYVLKNKYEGIPLEFGSNQFITNANLTDEIAEKLLARKNGERYFASIPEQDDSVKDTSDVSDASKNTSDLVNDFTRAELNKRAKELGLNPGDYPNKVSIAQAISDAENFDDIFGEEE